MPTHLDEHHLQTLCDLAMEAGAAIMHVYARGDIRAVHKADDSPLTEADLCADEIIRRGLDEAFPGMYVLSEESSSEGPCDPDADCLLVDPLDGTKEFLQRSGEFTVNIAWIRGGAPVAGVVFAPALGELFYAAVGIGAWKRPVAAAGSAAHAGGTGVPLRTRSFAAGQTLRVIGSRSHGTDALGAWLGALPHAHAFVAAGSSLKFCRIAEGQADIYPRFGATCQWDTAAAQCILEQAGGAVVEMAGGGPLRYGPQRPLVNREFVAVGCEELRGLCGQAASAPT